MKKLFLTLVISILFQLNINAQSDGWVWVNPLPQGNSLSDIKVTENLSAAVGYAGTIITNDGSGWELKDGGFDDVLFSVCIQGNNIWATGMDGTILHCSDGRGTSWETQTSGVDIQLRSVFFLTENLGWCVGLNETILRTTNGGNNWTIIYTGGTKAYNKVIFLDENNGWLAGTAGSAGVIRYTTDGGITWRNSVSPTSRINSIHFSDINFGCAVGDGGKIFRTTNGGADWALTASSTTANLKSVYLLSSGSGWAVGYDGTIINTVDYAANWSPQTSGTTEHLNAIYDGWVVGDAGKILHTSNAGATWEEDCTGFTDNLLSLDFVTDNIGYATGVNGKIYRTTDGGLTWLLLPTSITVGLGKVQFINLDTGWVASSHYIYRTIDGGSSWLQQLYLPQPNEVIFDIEFVKGLPGEPVMGFACGGLAGFWKSTNGGETWQGGAACTNGNFLGASFIDKNNGWLVGAPSTLNPVTIMRTTNGGGTFEEQTNPIIEPYMRDVSFVTNQRGLAVGNNGKTLYTIDGGANWEERPNGSNVWQEVFLSETGKAWTVGFYGSIAHSDDWGYTWQMQKSGVYETLNGIDFINDNEGWIVGNNGTILHTTNGGVSFIEEEQIDEMPTEYLLSQNYPNPFNSSSVIKYSILKSSQVSIKIFNTLGEEQETLVNQEKSVGTYELNWNAANLPSGVYFYRLQTGDFVQTKKMLLLK
jgi:photosystem II stability/assembly factor-like uncharacterized protein